MNRQFDKSTAIYIRSGKSKNPTHADEWAKRRQFDLTEYAKDLELPNIRIYTDCGFVGTNIRRPAFLALMRDIVQGKVSILIVQSISAIHRKSLIANYIVNCMLPRYGVLFYSIREGISPSLPTRPIYEITPTLYSYMRAQSGGGR